MGKGWGRQEMIDFDLFGKPIIPKIDIIRIPYQGSKNSIALDLFAKMLELKPKAKYFYDLTGGGGAMAFTALQLGLQVFYNEKNTALVNFIEWTFKRIRAGEKSIYGIFPEEFYNFIDRAKFKELVKEDSNYAQFSRICYSFGNSGKAYLFGEISEYSAPFKSVLEIKKAQLMNNSQEKKSYVLEKLYVNCDGI